MRTLPDGLDTSMEDFFSMIPQENFVTRHFKNACERLKCKTIREVVNYTKSEFRDQYMCGETTIFYADRVLADFGLNFKGEKRRTINLYEYDERELAFYDSCMLSLCSNSNMAFSPETNATQFDSLARELVERRRDFVNELMDRRKADET